MGLHPYRTNTPNRGTRYCRADDGAWFLDPEDGRDLIPLDDPDTGIFSPAAMDAGVARGGLILEPDEFAVIDAVPRAYDQGWQQVTCRGCGRSYRCTPADDYYARPGEEVTGPADGWCLTCLVEGPSPRRG